MSPAYKDFKVGKGSKGTANLELTGSMLDGFRVSRINNSAVRLQVTGSKNDKKADNHNHFRKFGTPTLPKRQFIPNPNQDKDRPFRSATMKKIEQILRRHQE